MKKTALLLLMMSYHGAAQAESFDFSQFYIATGLSVNKLDGFDNANGYQLLIGYDLQYSVGAASTSIEAGYMDSGDFDLTLAGLSSPPSTKAKGGWVSANISYPLDDHFKLLARGGYDFGNDEGALLGTGVEYHLSEPFNIRAEFISRDETDSFQINLTYALK
ncbi:MAG: porin family protein [Gammaproteobacteria bacterium]|nr:porin family protein [Gammaproteobacteria bacterium]